MQAGSGPPFGSPTDAISVLCFDRSTVKHALQNTQNDCHQWLSQSFRVHQIRFGQVYALDPAGELTALPRPLAGLRGPTSKGKGQEERRRGERMGEKGRGTPSNANSSIRPCIYICLFDLHNS